MLPWKTKSSKDIRVGDLHIWLRYGEASIQGRRNSQEDAHTATTDVAKRIASEEQRPVKQDDGHCAFFAIYDGHGGAQCSDFASQHLHKNFRQALVNSNDVGDALKKSIKKVEEEWNDKAYKEDLMDGSTACIAVINDNELHVANVGDSEGVLSRGGRAIPLCEVHNPHKNPHEAKRIIKEGGILHNGRIGHPKMPGALSLAVSRTIGDLPFKHPEYTDGKPSGVIAEPTVRSMTLTSEDDFMVLACDGVWDVLDYDEVVKFCLKRLTETDDPQQVAADLVQKAFEDGSYDNISALVITFKQFKAQDRTPTDL